MGLELRLNVTEHDIAGFYANPESRAALLASHSDSRTGHYFHPVLRTPLASCIGSFAHPGIAGILERQLGKSQLFELVNALNSADKTHQSLFDAAKAGKAAEDELITSLFKQLQALSAAYTLVGQLDTGSMDERQSALFDVGKDCLFLTVVYANEMYSSATGADFLGQVRESSVDYDCQSGMLAVLKSAGSIAERGTVNPAYNYGMLAAARSIVPKTL